MPFLTDKIQSTQREALAKSALDVENRAVKSADKMGGVTRLPNSRFELDIEGIEAELRDHIVGQDDSIDAVMQNIKAICVDIGDARKPLASMLFTGPTGVGKTETVRLLARGIYGDADALCRIDMNILAQEHYSAALAGAPPGYVGSKEGTTLLDPEKIEGTRNRPGIVLFDELEKASNEVVLALLNVLDNGIMTVASGEKTISFRNAMVFMTTNLGATELNAFLTKKRRLFDVVHGKATRTAKDVMLDCLLERFPPEFINRIDNIETFNSIEDRQISQIVAVEVEKLNSRLRKHNFQLTLGPEVIQYLSNKSYDARFGARALHRTVRKHLQFPLAEFLLLPENQTVDVAQHEHLTATIYQNKITFQRKNTL